MSELYVSVPKQIDQSLAKVSNVHNLKVYAWQQIEGWPNLG